MALRVDKRIIPTTMACCVVRSAPAREGSQRLMLINRLCVTLSVAVLSVTASAQQITIIPGIRAVLRPVSHHIPMGQPVWIRFSIENISDEPITLTVPGKEPAIPSPELGLPLCHVFSGSLISAVTVTTESGRRWEQPLGYRAGSEAPILLIAPRSSVGITLSLRDYFPALRGAGQYRITWQPYGGRVNTETVVLTIAPLNRAEIITDKGTMTLRFFYADAPQHVANFLDLVKSGFYTGKTFHRIEPGYFLQGGCPRGDGTGIRTDGKRLAAEFNGHPIRKGTVAMALLEDNPDSASCQFFICNTRQKEWDGRYTAFGELVGEESYETLDRLMATPVDEQGRPIERMYMRNVRIVDAPHDELP